VDSVRGFGKIGRGDAAGADREESMKIGIRLPMLAAAVLLVGMLDNWLSSPESSKDQRSG